MRSEETIAQDAERNRPCRRGIPLFAAILAVVLLFALAITGIFTWRSMAGSTKAGRDMAAKMLTLAGDHVLLQTAHFCQPVVELRDILARSPSAQTRPAGFDHPLLSVFLESLDSNPQLYSLYFAYADGGFFQAISLRDRPGLVRELAAPPQASYAVRTIAETGSGRVETWRFLDESLREVGGRPPADAGYDPRVRPWYTGALQSPEGFRSDPYVFASLKNLGVTLSRPVRGAPGAVLGLDVALDSLSRFVADQRIGRSGLVYLTSVSGQLIAYPVPGKLIQEQTGPDGKPKLTTAMVADLDDPLAKAMKDAFSEAGNRPFSSKDMTVAGVEYLVSVMPIPVFGSQNEYVAMAVPASEFIGPLQEAQHQGLYLVVGLLLVALPFMVMAARALARPLRQLTAEAVRISDLDMSPSPPISSRIAEVDTLCRAVESMKADFQVFGRYLPRSLMRHIQGGALSCLGGERREITLLFTDVADFTSLSEQLPPEELMQTISDYFQTITKAILDSNGTIDKFIGDAVMAFWNAPLPDEGHIELACAAALRLQKAGDAFNEHRLAAGLAPLRTRVGIHTGEAIVGNIGTDERMDYTALGSVVNLTSRLEALNKYYGTRILVSKRVRDAANKSFLFRSTDVVAPKGVAEAQATFELMGAKPKSEFADVALPSAMLGYCSRWERAMTLYRTKKWDDARNEFAALSELMPDDGLARRYLHRVEKLVAGGGKEDWKAAVRFTEK